MIGDIDDSLRALIEARVVQGANIEIAFDTPSKDWSARRQAPTLNLFLHDIREDLGRRQVQYEPEYNGEGIVVGRRTPPRKFTLSYMLTAWAERAEDEHRLLSSCLDVFIESDALPEAHRRGRAADSGPIRITTALPVQGGRAPSFWSQLGTPPRAAIDLAVTVPLAGRVDPHVGPPVLEGPKVAVLGPDGEPVPTMGRFNVDGTRRTPDRAQPEEPGREEGEAAAADGADEDAGTRETIDASRFRAGRRIEEIDPSTLLPGRQVGITTMPRKPR